MEDYMKEYYARKERAEKYGCDGRCETCIGTNTCEETALGEGMAELIIFLIILAIPISIIVTIIAILF